jgi:hypothetical protein
VEFVLVHGTTQSPAGGECGRVRAVPRRDQQAGVVAADGAGAGDVADSGGGDWKR